MLRSLTQLRCNLVQKINKCQFVKYKMKKESISVRNTLFGSIDY